MTLQMMLQQLCISQEEWEDCKIEKEMKILEIGVHIERSRDLMNLFKGKIEGREEVYMEMIQQLISLIKIFILVQLVRRE